MKVWGYLLMKVKEGESYYVKTRDNKNYLFAPYHDKEEYKEAYQSINKKLPARDRFEFLVFVERIRTSILTERENRQ